MKKFSILLVLVLALGIFGCKKKIDLTAKDPIWDRDVCARCKMQVSDRIHSAQIVNPQDGARYYFDDFGCAVLWLSDNNFTWKNEAIMYVTSGKNGEWLKSNEAVYAHDYITPMAFGVGAFKTQDEIESNKTIITYDEAVQLFKDIVAERMNQRKIMNEEEKSNAPADENDDTNNIM